MVRNRAFKQYLDMFVIVFIDDILIYSWSEKNMSIRVMLQFFKDHELYAKLRKCEFWLRFVSFIGHMVSDEGV